jgi:hypothetical protein
MAKAKPLSLAELNLVQKCDESMDLKPLGADGKELGITLHVLGAHATSVKKWINKSLNRRRQFEAMQAKRGKKSEVRPIEDDIEFGVEVVAIRLTGWGGLSDEFTPENALLLCETNPDICDQIREFSEDMTNLKKA